VVVVNRFFTLGALLCVLGVAAGAFGAHALRERLGARDLEIFEVAVRYQMYSGFGLLAAAFAAQRWPGPRPRLGGWLLLAGAVVFSGSLYALVLTQTRWLGAVTPLGGLAMMAGWLCLALSPRR
jgi:uncharacterized membrane protein YgdD (TMEM256/DUF423 family)